MSGAPATIRPRSRAIRWAVIGLIAIASLVTADRALKARYYAATHRYYEAGEVYWEDAQTLLLFSPDRYLFWRPKPNITMHLVETPEQYGLYWSEPRRTPYAFTVRTEARGLNTPAFECRKTPGTFRVVTLGDSRTMAEGVPYEATYARRLEARLAGVAGRRVEVINAGVSGYSSYQGRVLLERELLACDPDVVTVLFGINDQDTDQGLSDVRKAALFDSPLVTARQLANRSMLVYATRRVLSRLKGRFFGRTPIVPVAEPSDSEPERRVSIAEYEATLARLAALGREHSFRTLLLVVPTSPHAYFPELCPDMEGLSEADRRAIDESRALMDAGQVEAAMRRLEPLVSRPDAPSEARWLVGDCLRRLGRFEEAHRAMVDANRSIIFARYEGVVRRVAPGQAELVDLTPEFSEPRREPLYVDDMHPNSLGHDIIARRLAQAITAGRPGGRP